MRPIFEDPRVLGFERTIDPCGLILVESHLGRGFAIDSDGQLGPPMHRRNIPALGIEQRDHPVGGARLGDPRADLVGLFIEPMRPVPCLGHLMGSLQTRLAHRQQPHATAPTHQNQNHQLHKHFILQHPEGVTNLPGRNLERHPDTDIVGALESIELGDLVGPPGGSQQFHRNLAKGITRNNGVGLR